MPPSNNKKNNKKPRSNMSGLITLIAWALFLTVIINFIGQLFHAQCRKLFYRKSRDPLHRFY